MGSLFLMRLLSLLAVFLDVTAAHNDCLQPSLKYGCQDHRTKYAYICCNNRDWAERRGFHGQVNFLHGLEQTSKTTGVTEFTFYDSKCGVPLFVAPRGRSLEVFMDETRKHGWPSFRDQEVVTAHVLKLHGTHGAEIVSSCGTHLGHNLPDYSGNRYCINLMCMAGSASTANQTDSVTLSNNQGARSDVTGRGYRHSMLSVVGALQLPMLVALVGC